MRQAIPLILALLPIVAFAGDRCEHSRSLDIAPRLEGVGTVVFDVGPHELDVRGSPGATPRFHGRACASDARILERLRVVQRREGDRLLVELVYDEPGWASRLLGGFSRRSLSVTATLPDDLAVEVAVGSGDAEVRGFETLELSVGSGDAIAQDLRGPVSAKVGSGDIDLHDIGSLRVESVGSGDLRARVVAGDVAIGRIGSGDAEVGDVSGSIEVGSIGSGDLDVRRVRGDLRVSRVGSGDVDHAGVEGAVGLPDGS